MGAWDGYTDRITKIGGNKRGAMVHSAKGALAEKMMDSAACHRMLVNGEPHVIGVRHGETLHEKRIWSMPDEELVHGGYVDWNDTKWIITEVDALHEVFQRGYMIECNHILRWINREGKIIEKWAVVQDGTKYLVGEKVTEMMTIGDARVAVIVPKDDDTIQLQREMRFIIDDTAIDDPLVYKISKPNRLYNIYNDKGVYRYILTEVSLEEGDNVKKRIANYSDWKPRTDKDSDHVDSTAEIVEIVAAATSDKVNPADLTERGGWI